MTVGHAVEEGRAKAVAFVSGEGEQRLAYRSVVDRTTDGHKTLIRRQRHTCWRQGANPVAIEATGKRRGPFPSPAIASPPARRFAPGGTRDLAATCAYIRIGGRLGAGAPDQGLSYDSCTVGYLVPFDACPGTSPACRRAALRPMCPAATPAAGWPARLLRVQGGAIRVRVTSLRKGQVKFEHTQARYDPNEIYAQPDFAANLSEAQRTMLRQFLDDCNPRPMCDLVQGGGPVLAIGTMEFQCTADDLLSGLVETIYAMRNALLHGEVEPDSRVLACYEPAYRIVMQFLACI